MCCSICFHYVHLLQLRWLQILASPILLYRLQPYIPVQARAVAEAMAGFHVHLCVGKTTEMDGTIILESTASKGFEDYNVWHSFESFPMLKLGSRHKKLMCPLWQFHPFRHKVAEVARRPMAEVGHDRSTILAAMDSLAPHQWCSALFDGGHYDAYVMASYDGGCDIYMRTPQDRPMHFWWHYAARDMAADPTFWRTMPLHEPRFIAIEPHPEWTQELLCRVTRLNNSAI